MMKTLLTACFTLVATTVYSGQVSVINPGGAAGTIGTVIIPVITQPTTTTVIASPVTVPTTVQSDVTPVLIETPTNVVENTSIATVSENYVINSAPNSSGTGVATSQDSSMIANRDTSQNNNRIGSANNTLAKSEIAISLNSFTSKSISSFTPTQLNTAIELIQDSLLIADLTPGARSLLQAELSKLLSVSN